MANPRANAVFFIFLVLSAHAYRLENANGDKLQVEMNGTAAQVPYGAYAQGNGAVARAAQAGYRASASASQGALHSGYWVVQQSSVTTTISEVSQTVYTSPFHATSVVTTSSGSYTRTSITSVVEHCAPGIVEGPIMNLKPPGGPPAIAPMWPLLIAAGVVLMGGLYLYHRHRMNGPVEASFCPVSSWESDPAGLLVGPAAFDAFGENFAPFLSEDNNRGMPKCHGLRRHRLREDCDGDVDCKRQACRQMCCDRRDCTFFQFNTIDSTDNCWLGSRSRLSTETCEQPFFGETCTTCRDRRAELWSQVHEDNMKCHSAVLGFTGFHVENQYECQAHATDQGHEYYQYDATRQKCETEATCDSPSSNTIHSWQIFSSRNMPAQAPEAARPSPDQEVWQFEPFLFHENRGMTTVQLTGSQQCNAGDITCMRDACRAICAQHDWCIHYQFENGGDSCELGASHVIDEDDVGMWFGGMLTQNRLCAVDEYKCPSSHNCVDACGSECDGHSRESPDGWCVRSAVENIVDTGHWTDTYNQHPIDAWCRGIERTVVTVSAGLGNGQNGADICRAACSADSTCALWQMYPSDAENDELGEGDHVRCWLGMEDQLGRPRFTCTGRSPKRWRLLSAPRSEAVLTRGCQDGKVACVLSQRCVDLCQDECPGFEITDPMAGICQPQVNPMMMAEGLPMDLALSHNIPQMIENPDYALLADEADLFTMSVNLQRLINPDTFEGDTTAVCDVISGAECDLIGGACVCEYDDDIDCSILFGHSQRVIPVLAEEGMMVMSHDGCSCDGRTCTLSLMSSVPPVRTSEQATSAVQLSNDDMEHCDVTVTCPNMDTCTSITYGGSGCGYECDNSEGHFWCSNRCACNKEEAVSECTTGVTCPSMHSCEPISYGEYGCGYGCMRDSTYLFCNDACTVCNE